MPGCHRTDQTPESISGSSQTISKVIDLTACDSQSPSMTPPGHRADEQFLASHTHTQGAGHDLQDQSPFRILDQLETRSPDADDESGPRRHCATVSAGSSTPQRRAVDPPRQSYLTAMPGMSQGQGANANATPPFTRSTNTNDAFMHSQSTLVMSSAACSILLSRSEQCKPEKFTDDSLYGLSGNRSSSPNAKQAGTSAACEGTPPPVRQRHHESHH